MTVRQIVMVGIIMILVALAGVVTYNPSTHEVRADVRTLELYSGYDTVLGVIYVSYGDTVVVGTSSGVQLYSIAPGPGPTVSNLPD